MKLNLVSVNMRLLRLVSPFIAIVLLQAFLAGMSLSILSSVRAYVGGESLWSKGQKDAVHHLYLYGETGDDRHYEAYQSAIARPLGDRDARLALEQSRRTLQPPVPASCKAAFMPTTSMASSGCIAIFASYRLSGKRSCTGSIPIPCSTN